MHQFNLHGGTPVETIDDLIPIYQQMNEPEEKTGIWIKRETETEDVYINQADYDKQETITYTKRANVPYQIGAKAVTGLIGNNIYILGGEYPYSQYNYMYNIQNNTYTKKANSSKEIMYSIPEAVGTDIYVFGGHYDKNYNYESPKFTIKYDSVKNTYTTLVDLPTTVDKDSGAAILYDNEIYLISSSHIYIYNIEKNEYTNTGNSLTGSYDNIFLFEGKFYALEIRLYVYDLATNTRSTFLEIPSPYEAWGSGAVLIDNEIYAFGGNSMSSSSGSTNKCWKVNLLTKEITELPDYP